MFTLKSISAYRKDESRHADRLRRAAGGRCRRAGHLRQQAVQPGIPAAEINRGPLQGLVGAYYLDADARRPVRRTQAVHHRCRPDRRSPTPTSTPRPGRCSATSPTTSPTSSACRPAAATPATSARREILRKNYLGGGSPAFGGDGIPFGPAPTTNFDGKRKDTAFTPRASVSFKPNDHHIYASYSKGFKGGGFDPRGVGTNAPDLDSDGPPTPRRSTNLWRSTRKRSTATSWARRARCSTTG